MTLLSPDAAIEFSLTRCGGIPRGAGRPWIVRMFSLDFLISPRLAVVPPSESKHETARISKSGQGGVHGRGIATACQSGEPLVPYRQRMSDHAHPTLCSLRHCALDASRRDVVLNEHLQAISEMQTLFKMTRKSQSVSCSSALSPCPGLR
jgi:hypothetical protein